MSEHFPRRYASVGAAALMFMGSAYAQTPPDAGALQQQIERERAVQLPKRLAPEKPAEPAAMKPTGGVAVTVSYPIVRARLQNLFLALNYDRKTFDNESAGAVTSRYKVDAFTIGLNGNLFDNLGGGGANSASLSYVGGNVDLGGSPNRAADALTTQTAGHYGKLRWSLSRQQVVTGDLSLFGQLSGQTAGKNLDSSEKFYLGGAFSVRAYPSNEGGGAEGRMLNLELRWKLPEGFTLTGFYDYGRVTVNRNNGFAGAANLNDYSLKGDGLSLAWATPVGVNLKAVWARRIGDNPNPTATGNDQDGTLVKNRFWLTAALPFY
jgi:hemolysin activation/secretion protein